MKELYRPQTWLEELVYHLLRHHGFTRPEEIKVTEICATFHVEIWQGTSRSCSFPHPAKPGWHVIQVNRQLPLCQRRETIAHELGHLILHEGVQPFLPDLMVTLQEQQTGHFVEHLLVPFYMFEPFADRVDRYRAADYIARRFRVTRQTARRRFERFLSRVYKFDPHLL